MKSKLLICSALVFVVLCFNRCTPEEVQTTQDQFKPYIIRVSTSQPITPMVITNGVFYNYMSLGLESNLGNVEIGGGVPDNVGLDQIQIQGTTVANTPLEMDILYGNQVSANLTTGIATYACDVITLEIFFDGVLVYTAQKNMGGPTCSSTGFWHVNYTF